MPDVLELLKKLPERAFINNRRPDGSRVEVSCDAPTLSVTRGVPGYTPIYSPLSADELNDGLGVSPPQREAMLHGSMFGWHTKGADPDQYDAAGVHRFARTGTSPG